MSKDIANHIQSNPKFRHLVRTRNIYTTIVSSLVMVVYFGYILVVAFGKEFLAQKISAEFATSIGILLWHGMILFTLVITIFHVHFANTRLDTISAEILKEADK